LLIAFLISLTVYAFMNNWSWVAALFALLIFIQVIMIAAKIKKASQIQDYAIISRDLKLLMLSGILSMISYQL
jgi:hypothetical protein